MCIKYNQDYLNGGDLSGNYVPLRPNFITGTNSLSDFTRRMLCDTRFKALIVWTYVVRVTLKSKFINDRTILHIGQTIISKQMEKTRGQC